MTFVRVHLFHGENDFVMQGAALGHQQAVGRGRVPLTLPTDIIDFISLLAQAAHTLENQYLPLK